MTQKTHFAHDGSDTVTLLRSTYEQILGLSRWEELWKQASVSVLDLQEQVRRLEAALELAVGTLNERTGEDFDASDFV